MSALNRHEEFEQLLRGMRNRLVSVSDEVSRTITKANWHAETAPAHVRARVQAGIADITATQDWLQARLAQLPEDPQVRYAAMQEMLQVQFVAVQKVTTILDELLALRNKPVSPAYMPTDVRQPPPYGGFDPGGPIARDFAPALASPATAPLFDPPVARQPLYPAEPQQPFAYPAPQPMHPHGAMSPPPHWEPPREDYAREPQWGPLPAAFGPAAHHPSAVHLADLEPSLAPPMAPGEMPRALAGRRAEPKAAQRGARKSEKQASRSRIGMVTIGLVAAIAIVAVGGTFAWKSISGGSRPQRVAIGDPAARNVANAGNTAVPVRSVDPIVSRVPQAPPMSAPPFPEGTDDFVPVIATHREKDGLTNLFMELRKQYPGIVATRKAIAQTVNLGNDGVWYQLVLLPPGPRTQAEGICDELKRAGYTRCAVRPNKP